MDPILEIARLEKIKRYQIRIEVIKETLKNIDNSIKNLEEILVKVSWIIEDENEIY